MIGRGAARERRRMVERQLARRDITDAAVLEAMATVPRELFVPPEHRHEAYADRPLPIGHHQTISQPYIVALMTQAARLTPGVSRVLEVGTGSGYHAAVLARIARHVWTIERIAALAEHARALFQQLGFANITSLVGDGAAGHPDAAPYDAILTAAAAPRPPQALVDQLAVGGRLVLPVGGRALQELTVFERTSDGVRADRAGAVRFVPLVSPEGFDDLDG